MQLWRRYWKYCPDYLQERMTVLNTVSCVVPNVLNFDNDQLTEILLYDKEDLDNINNTSILDATINYLIETKRFATQLIWCSLDVMALTSRLHLKFMFLLFCFLFFVFVFAIFIFLVFLGYFFHILYAFFSIPLYAYFSVYIIFCSVYNIYMYNWQL